jgi:hypothetical protein
MQTYNITSVYNIKSFCFSNKIKLLSLEGGEEWEVKNAEILAWKSATQSAEGEQGRSPDEADKGRSARGSIAEIDVLAAVDAVRYPVRAHVG